MKQILLSCIGRLKDPFEELKGYVDRKDYQGAYDCWNLAIGESQIRVLDGQIAEGTKGGLSLVVSVENLLKDLESKNEEKICFDMDLVEAFFGLVNVHTSCETL